MKSASSSPKSFEKDVAKDRYQFVNKVMEGLRGNAFLVTRDMGFAAPFQPGGLRSLVAKIKASVFARGSGEAKELLRLGQVRQGVLLMCCKGQLSEALIEDTEWAKWFAQGNIVSPCTSWLVNNESTNIAFMLDCEIVSTSICAHTGAIYTTILQQWHHTAHAYSSNRITLLTSEELAASQAKAIANYDFMVWRYFCRYLSRSLMRIAKCRYILLQQCIEH